MSQVDTTSFRKLKTKKVVHPNFSMKIKNLPPRPRRPRAWFGNDNDDEDESDFFCA